MSEQLLDDPQVGAALEQMRRERVAQRVRADPARQPGPSRRAVTAAQACCRARRRPRSPRNSGPPRTGATWMRASSAARGPSSQRRELVERHLADRHEPLLVALADHPHERAVEREVLAVEPDRLAHPQAGGVEQLEQGPVADAAGGGAPRAAGRPPRRRACRAGAGSGAAGRGAPRRRRRSGPRRTRSGRSPSAPQPVAAGSSGRAPARRVDHVASGRRGSRRRRSADARPARRRCRSRSVRSRSDRSDRRGSSRRRGRARRGGRRGSPRSPGRGSRGAVDRPRPTGRRTP